MIPRHHAVVHGVLELIWLNPSKMAHGGDCDTLHSQGSHDKMPTQLGRTRGKFTTHLVWLLARAAALQSVAFSSDKRNPPNLNIGSEETSYLLLLSPIPQKPQDSKQSRGQDGKCWYPCTKTCQIRCSDCLFTPTKLDMKILFNITTVTGRMLRTCIRATWVHR